MFFISVVMIILIISLPILIFFYLLLANVILLGLTFYLIAILPSSLYVSIKRSIRCLIAAPIYAIEYLVLTWIISLGYSETSK